MSQSKHTDPASVARDSEGPVSVEAGAKPSDEEIIEAIWPDLKPWTVDDDDKACCDRIRALFAASASPASAPSRDEIAKAIREAYYPRDAMHESRNSFRFADAVLALFPASPDRSRSEGSMVSQVTVSDEMVKQIVRHAIGCRDTWPTLPLTEDWIEQIAQTSGAALSASSTPQAPRPASVREPDYGAIWLRREGDRVLVLVERDGVWREVIREFFDGNFSHIVEPAGIEGAFSGGISVAAPSSGEPKPELPEKKIRTCACGKIELYPHASGEFEDYHHSRQKCVPVAPTSAERSEERKCIVCGKPESKCKRFFAPSGEPEERCAFVYPYGHCEYPREHFVHSEGSDGYHPFTPAETCIGVGTIAAMHVLTKDAKDCLCGELGRQRAAFTERSSGHAHGVCIYCGGVGHRPRDCATPCDFTPLAPVIRTSEALHEIRKHEPYDTAFRQLLDALIPFCENAEQE